MNHDAVAVADCLMILMMTVVAMAAAEQLH
jgi:hypothetical protein